MQHQRGYAARERSIPSISEDAQYCSNNNGDVPSKHCTSPPKPKTRPANTRGKLLTTRWNSWLVVKTKDSNKRSQIESHSLEIISLSNISKNVGSNRKITVATITIYATTSTMEISEHQTICSYFPRPAIISSFWTIWRLPFSFCVVYLVSKWYLAIAAAVLGLYFCQISCN